MTEQKKKKRSSEAVEPGAAFFLIEKLAKKCLEVAAQDWDPRVQLEQMSPLLEVIRDTAKTARFSVSVANKQALERLVQLPGGLLIPTFKPGPITTQPFDKDQVKDPVPPDSIT